MNRSARHLALLLLALLVALPACATSPRTSTVQADKPEKIDAAAKKQELVVDAAFAGHYYLEGVMETGSELLLREDGRFQWYFTYGALDLISEGKWQREGSSVILLPDVFRAPADYEQMEFKRMTLRIDGNELVPAWPWEDGKERGSYVRE